ncbi:hypothetical protein DI272_43740 [Streptomyces sp. Act143]|uniref:hypothetical protein n=1 Tax=Streptomyces sp. Act143 TaxID=2200760 RepID=UPI000D67DC3D|nr:hypothetical protein [Streptomyces sp. Act143]PWI12636.1 hypothetical protein DI272_43740 [Streptomyces sp. Act143]
MSTRIDMSPWPPDPELRQALDEAAQDCATAAFPRDRILRRARRIKRRRRLVTGTLAVALLTPIAFELGLPTGHTNAHTVTGSPRPPAARPSASPSPTDGRSPVRVVRPGERIEAGLGVWYLLREREYCDAGPDEKDPICVGDLDVNQPGTIPMTFNVSPRPQGVVYIFAYTGRTAARITMTEKGRTTVLPIVRLAGRPAYVSSYAVAAPRPAGASKDLFGGGVLFRVYDDDGKELARVGHGGPSARPTASETRGDGIGGTR